MEQSSDKSGPRDDVLGHIISGGGEQEQASVDEATFGVGVEEVVEEERVGNVVLCDELGMNLGDMFAVLGVSSVV